jgi:hypothetical protein
MTRPIVFVLLLHSAAIALAADPPEPRSLSGSAQDAGAVAATLGPYGAWLVESAQRWDEVLKMLADKGVNVENHLGDIDWTRENIACVFHVGDEGDQFSVRKMTGDANLRDVDLLMSYIIYKQHGKQRNLWKIFAIPVARATATRVSISTFHPMNGGPYPTADKAFFEWEWTFSAKTGEDIGGLTGLIEPTATTVKPGQDIRVRFTLLAADTGKDHPGRFSPALGPIHVWDGKYSNGYRNHSFLVLTPDGKRLPLAPRVIANWEKNAPHLVTITPQERYVLPSWTDPLAAKSLKQLGLDTSKPGVYTITGIYEESSPNERPAGAAPWGGILRTNTVRVEVK